MQSGKAVFAACQTNAYGRPPHLTSPSARRAQERRALVTWDCPARNLTLYLMRSFAHDCMPRRELKSEKQIADWLSDLGVSLTANSTLQPVESPL
jgi:hypothetical protein